MKRPVSLAGPESVAVPPWIPSITGFPLFKSRASSSAVVKSWVGGPPPRTRYMTFFFFIAKISTDNKMSANMSPMFSANKSLTSLQNILVFNRDLLPSPFLARHVCSLRGIDRYK